MKNVMMVVALALGLAVQATPAEAGIVILDGIASASASTNWSQPEEYEHAGLGSVSGHVQSGLPQFLYAAAGVSGETTTSGFTRIASAGGQVGTLPNSAMSASATATWSLLVTCDAPTPVQITIQTSGAAGFRIMHAGSVLYDSPANSPEFVLDFLLPAGESTLSGSAAGGAFNAPGQHRYWYGGAVIASIGTIPSVGTCGTVLLGWVAIGRRRR